MTQESKEAEDIQSVVGQEEQTVSQQGAKTAALKGTHVPLLQAAQHTQSAYCTDTEKHATWSQT